MNRMLALLLSVLLLTGCTPAAPSGSQSTPPAQSVLQPLPAPEPEPEPIVAHLMVGGDIMSHDPQIEDAYIAETGEYSYYHMMAEAAPQLKSADYAVANLETTLAGGPHYSGYPNFNSPDGLAVSIQEAGFDLLSTANNHSRDKGMDGIYRTLDVLDEVGLAHVGTHRSQTERDANHGIYVADVGGISVAFLAYTYGMNGYQLDPDKMFAVNLFNKDYYTTLCDPDYDLLAADMAAARALDTDLIAVIMHWGNEYKDAPNAYQTNMAQFLADQGADLILGGHPHVLEPYEMITGTGPDGQEHQAFVCYSLGNFISCQTDLETKTTVVLDLELTHDPASDQTTVTDVRYTPYYMHRDNHLPIGSRRTLLHIHNAMAEYEAGGSKRISAALYQQLSAALDHCHAILGPEDDRPSI